jgi:hypothetical protein
MPKGCLTPQAEFFLVGGRELTTQSVTVGRVSLIVLNEFASDC